MVTQLLAGVAASANVNVSLGDQVQQLATGMSIMAEAGITDDDAYTVSSIIREIGGALESIRIDEDSIKSVAAISATLTALGKIDKETIDNIKNLKSLNVSAANNIVKFISALDFTKIEVLKDKNMGVALKNLSVFMNSVVSILDRNTSGIFGLMNPVRAWMLGKAIGIFFNNMVKAIPTKQIKIELKGVGDLLKALDPLIAPNSKYSIKRLKKVVNEENGQYIGSFFAAMIREIPKRKNMNEAIENIAKLMDVLLKNKPKDIKAVVKVYNEKNGKKIGLFLSEIVDGVKSAKELKSLESVAKFLHELTKLSMLDVMTMKMAFSVMNAKAGKNVSDFINNLTAGLTDAKVKKLKQFNESMVDLSHAMMFFSGSIVVVAAAIATLGFTTVLGSVAVVIASMNFILKMVKKVAADSKSIEKATKHLNSLMVAVSIMTANVIALAFVAKMADKIQWESLAKVGAMMVAVVGIMAVATKLGKDWKKNGKDMLLGMIGVTTLLIGGAMAVKIAVQVAAENKIEDLALGVGIVMGVMLMTVGLVKLLAKNNRNLKNGLISMAVMTALLATTALIINNLIIPIGEEAGPAALGMLVVGMTMLGMTMMIKILGSVKNKNLVQATLCVGIMSFIMLGIGLITKEILIPLGLEAEAAFVGAGTAMALTLGFGLLTALFGVVFNKKRLSYLKNGVIGLVAIAGVMVVLTEASKHFMTLVEAMNGMTAEDIGMAGLTVVALVGSIGAIAFGIGKLLENKTIMKDMAIGGVAIVAIGAVISILSSCMMDYVALAKEVSTVSAGDLTAAGLTIAACVGAFGLIMAGIGALMLLPGVAVAVAAGAATMVGVSAVISLTSVVMEDYVKKATEIAKYPEDKVMAGSTLMIKLLGEFGLLMGAAGLLAIPVAVGGLVLVEVIGIMNMSNKAIRTYAELSLAMIAMNGGKKEFAGGDLQMGSNLMLQMLRSFKSFMSEFDASIIKQSLYIRLYRNAMMKTLDVVQEMAKIAVYTKNNLTLDDVALFHSIMIGEGLSDKDSMLGSLNIMINGLMTLGDSIGWGIKLGIAITASKKILDVISNFIDVIAKVSTLTYVMGYDSNGRPMFGKIKPEDFGKAADVTTLQFKNFIDRMIGGFEKIDIIAVILCMKMKTVMNPVIDILGKFVDIVLKVSTSTYIIGYDENGKPMYVKLTADEFGMAAQTITSSFSTFIEQMITNFGDISLKSAIMLEIMGESMVPIMDALGNFADTILKTASGTYIIGYDENGHAQYMKITDDQLKNAATTITTNFISFIQALEVETKKMNHYSARMIERLGEGLGELMGSIGGFADGIIKIAGGTYITGYDENGKPIIEKISDEQLNNAASIIIDKFCTFVDNLTTSTKELKRKQAKALGELGNAMGPIMSSVSSFADSVIKFAGGSYISGYDENGKPLYERISYDQIKLAAGQIMGYYKQFMQILLDFASQDSFKTNGEKYMATIGKIMAPIMDSVVDFSEMIVNFMKPQGTIKKDGKEVAFFLDLTKIKDASVNIAKAYITFVSTVVEEMNNNENFKKNIVDASTYIADVAKVIKATATSSKEFKELITNVSEIKGLSDIASGKSGNYAELYVKSLVYIAKMINEADVNFALANQTMIIANAFLKNCISGSSMLKDIMNNLAEIKSLSAYETKLGQFTGSMNKLNEIGSLEFNDGMMMVQFLQQSVMAAHQLKMIYDVMSDNNMTKAVHTFVNNIQTLSSTDTSDKMTTASRNMALFSEDLTTFRNTLSVTKTETISFTASVNSAITSIRNLDNAILSREKKRNESLKEFSDLIQNIATSVDNLSEKIEKLDKNQILENFKGIRDLLSLASGNVPASSGTQTTLAATQTVQKTEEKKPETQVIQQPKMFGDGGTIVEFRFDNIQFTGIATTKDY